MDDIILKINGISKSFFGVYALKNVSFDLKRGHLLGLIGENGAGKSTLMNIIGGVLPPDAGTIELDGEEYRPKDPADATEAGIAFIHQELNLFTNLSVAENIFIDTFPNLGALPIINNKAINEKTKKLLEAIDLKVSPDVLVERLAPGERQLVEIAKALNVDARIIIFDEPTTSLTARETERLFELIKKLKDEGRTIIYISHILEDVKMLADDIVVLRDGEVTSKGPIEDYDIPTMISHMVGREIGQLYPERKSKPRNENALEVRNVSQSGIVNNISFNLKKGEVLGMFGLMGSGRTELARILFGLDPFEKGTITVNGQNIKKTSPIKCIKNNMAFVTENRREEGLLMEVPISENIGLVTVPRYASKLLKFVNKQKLYQRVKEIVDKLNIKCASFKSSKAKSLSGGNQQKVVIGKWLMSSPSILIVDEPTRGIDVGAKNEVYNIIRDLAAEGSSILVISSELEELIGICDRIIVMSRGEIVGEFDASEFDKEKILGTAFRQNVV